MKPALPTTVPPSAPSTDLDQIPPPWSDIPQTWEDDGGGGAETLTSSTSFEVGSSSSDGDGSKQDSKRTKVGKSPAGAVGPGPKLVKKGDSPPSPTPTRIWHSELLRNSTFRILSNLTNAVRALELAPEWAGVLGYNEFSQKIATLRPLPWDVAAGKGKGNVGGRRTWTDQEDRLTAIWLQENGVQVALQTAGEAALTVSLKHRFNPVLSYLNSLTWDGVDRLGEWLTTYMGVEKNAYTTAVGKLWMISGAARAMAPGCKVDCALILEGKQGTKKSTALRDLMPTPDLFTDDLSDIGEKDAIMQVHGPWLVEIAELTAMSRSDTERVKAFISRQVDHYRKPYGKHTEDIPRTCFFAGTTNRETWNRDETGGRRFWPVRTTDINLEGLGRDRDQLWAEAVVRYKAGEKWWIDNEELLGMAEKEQAARFEADAWFDSIANWVEAPIADPGCMLPLQSTPTCVATADILAHCLRIYDMGRWGQGEQNRVAKCMKALGWDRRSKRVDGKIVKAYFKV